MDKALFIAASGMAAQQQNLDTIAENLANADVAGFKGSVQRFADLAAPGGSVLGTIALGAHPLFTQGKLTKGGGAFDVALEGAGLFALQDSRGNVLYGRGGAFARAADGSLQDDRGMRLRGIRVPSDATSVTVSETGVVSATLPGGTHAIGRLAVFDFAAPDRLRSTGGTLFEATSESGAPHRINLNAENAPKIRFGMLERSNVSIVEAMMQILAAQRAYEANAKGVQAADEMLRIANNLQRG